METFRYVLLAVVLWIGPLGLAGCDSDPITPPPASEVSGSYAFEQLTFEPDASALQAANVLDSLVVSATTLELLDGGQYSLSYQLRGGTNRIVSGDFDLTTESLTLRTTETGAEELRGLLLDTPLRLTRSADGKTLVGSLDRTVNLEAYDASMYAGFTEVAGTLLVTFRRQP